MSKRKRPTRRPPNTPPAARPVRTVASLPAGTSTQDEPGSFRSPLSRLLDTPHLVRLVPRLAPETLHQLIRHAGLEACGEIVAAATAKQLTSVLDLDLWRHARPGRDDEFDADRFGDWLELLVDTGPAVAARIVAGLAEPLVVAGLSRYIRVFDPSTIAAPELADDDLSDAAPTARAGSECEVGGYLVCAIRADAWDAIVALLTALEAEHAECFHAVLRECRRLSNSEPEVDGLDDLLMEPAQLLHDVALDRENRRSRLGYSTPADARAFLQMARQRSRQRPGTPSINPIAAAYFRAVDDGGGSAVEASRLSPPAPEPGSTDAVSADALDAITGLLAEAGLVPERPRALLEGGPSEPSRLTHIRRLMECASDLDATAYLARTGELAFLANTLMAGCSIQSRPFTAQEASDAAVGICNLGLEHWPARWPDAGTHGAPSTAGLAPTLPDAFLVGHDLVTAFEVGWAVLHEDVSLFVTERLIVTLTGLRSVDSEVRDGLRALRRQLVKERDAGTLWRVRAALDVIGMLDMPAWASLLGLLDECPILPTALTATLEGRTGAVSATTFEFISTTGQIGEVRLFMGKLLDLLSR